MRGVIRLNQAVADASFLLRIELERPVEWRIGQHFSIGLAGLGVNREYSCLDSDGRSQTFDFLYKVVEGGVLTPQLSRLTDGDEVEVWGPFGEFLQTETWLGSGRRLAIATGTGISPFLSEATRKKGPHEPPTQMSVLYGLRSGVDYFDGDGLLGRIDSLTVCYSRQQAPQGSFGGRVTDFLRENPRFIEPFDAIALCGNRKMIAETYSILREQGFPENQIESEVFF